VGHQDKSWASHICCLLCVRLLIGWVNGSRQTPFAVPMIWGEPKDHYCYCCLTNIARITIKSKQTVKCPDLSSAMRPVPHSEWLPVPKPPKSDFSDDTSDYDEDHGQQEGENVDCDPPSEASRSSSEPHVLISTRIL
jgi:hypothetical protein